MKDWIATRRVWKAGEPEHAESHMSELTKRRLAISEAKFDAYHFGWKVEEVHHWHIEDQGNEFCRTVLFCGGSPGDPCVRGHFHVRFLPRRATVDECYAMIDGCLIGHDPDLAQTERRAS
jgi:hypothetical protein